MTDEEKAKEYTDNINTIIYDIDDNAINIAKYLRKAYLDGLAEERKEAFSEATIKNLKENTSVINAVVMGKLSEKCERLEAQNEKLKCCGNCKNRGLEKYNSYPCDRCKRWHRDETFNDYWEMKA